MKKYLNTVITGTGSYIPTKVVSNSAFTSQIFFEKDNSPIDSPGEEITRKFKDITGIYERRYVENDQSNADIATIAAQRAIESSGIDPETIDQIIVAHNFGDVISESIQTDILPSIASRVKNRLGIQSETCIPYDIIFGCPGWVQGVLQAHAYFKAGMAKRCLVIGSETLSRIVDRFDRDTMIFSDGAGATIVEAIEEDQPRGLLTHATVSHTNEEVNYLYLGQSNSPDSDPKIRYIKMQGRKIYEYSLNNVPRAMKAAFDASGLSITEVKKILIHQANEKMDEAIVQRFYRLFGIRTDVYHVMPMNIQRLGNSSVATVPTLYDMILRNELPDHTISSGDILIFASVGAGMNINAFVYRQ
ncbi:MAG TPA: ketoacyl-ACP synthase III [Bacteroidales bacterium]|nr:ketoacyl-ACP synthase III [Bacteroidales bacterium]